jgi:hypothetical protein
LCSDHNHGINGFTPALHLQSAMGHSQNRLTTEGHVKQTDADNMWSFMDLQNTHGMTQVRAH